ncbi:MAG: hypothetical protein VKJ64_22005 [Leptolyngbyaceae bacterium]|nr:hypothetical protein [Leptolyngbyaceae bacterium]
MTTRSFVESGVNPAAVPHVRVSVNVYANNAPDREPVRLLLIGSRQGVNSIIHVLHHLRFAEVFEWSQALDAPDLSKPLHIPSGEVMRVLTKYLPLL